MGRQGIVIHSHTLSSSEWNLMEDCFKVMAGVTTLGSVKHGWASFCPFFSVCLVSASLLLSWWTQAHLDSVHCAVMPLHPRTIPVSWFLSGQPGGDNPDNELIPDYNGAWPATADHCWPFTSRSQSWCWSMLSTAEQHSKLCEMETRSKPVDQRHKPCHLSKH